MHPQSPALRALAEKWDAVPTADRTNFQSYINELCDALGVARPHGPGYEFEYPVNTVDRRTGKETTHFIDLYRPGHFVLLVRNVEPGAGANQVIAPAYGEAKRYAHQVAHGPPPYVMVMNVGRRLLYWDRWKGEYGRFNDSRPIDLRPLWMNHGSIDLLRALWDDPASLDPNAVLKRVLPDIEIVYRPEGREIVLDDAAVAPVVEALMQTGTRFRFYDPLYGHPPDSGAYVTYTPRNGVWGMEVANHGWSGGEYGIEAAVVCTQLRHLLGKGLLHTITIYELPATPSQELGRHDDMNRQLLKLHGPGSSSGV